MNFSVEQRVEAVDQVGNLESWTDYRNRKWQNSRKVGWLPMVHCPRHDKRDSLMK